MSDTDRRMDGSFIEGALDQPCAHCTKTLGQHPVFGRGHDFAPMVAPSAPATHESDNRSHLGELDWVCRGCGCTDDHACLGGCQWEDRDADGTHGGPMCSRCVAWTELFS